MLALSICTAALFICSANAAVPQCYVPNYRILMTPLPNFLEVTTKNYESHYTGFLIDLIYAVAKVANFTFTITLGEDSNFGRKVGEVDGISCYNGAIGQMQAQEFDIYVGALDNVYGYNGVVDFTTPIFRSSIQTIYNTKTGLKESKYAILANTAGRDIFEISQDPRIQAIWANVQKNAPTSLPSTYDDAIALVKSGGWAFVGKTPLIDEAVCNSHGLIAKDSTVYKKTYAAFAVQKGSNILSKLNLAILQLHGTNTIDTLLAKWFPCSDFNCS